jgi:hypothetical protein
MTFSLSTSKNYIDIDEPNIVEIYRSAQLATPPDPMYDGHPCEAYLCTGRENGLLLAYAAILDAVTGVPFIFTATCDVKDTAACRQLVAEANDFIAALGFALEKVSIDYGAAMRQVIIRNLRIMRPPDRNRSTQIPRKQAYVENKQLDPAKGGTEAAHHDVLLAPSRPQHPPVPSEPVISMTCQDDTSRLATELSALQAAFERLCREKGEAEVTTRQAMADLAAQVEQARAACRNAEQSEKENRVQYRQMIDSQSLEIDLLKAELARAVEVRQAAEESLGREIDRHRESEAWSAEVAARLEAALEEGGTRQAALEVRLHAVDADPRKSESALEAEVKRRSENETAAKKRERLLRKELAALREEGNATRVILQDLEKQCRALMEERDAAQSRLSEILAAVRPEHEEEHATLMAEVQQLKEVNETLAGYLEEAKREHVRALRKNEMELSVATEKIESLAADLERFSSEKQASDFVVGSFKKKVRDAVVRLRKEKQGLEDEVRRLREKGDENTRTPSYVSRDYALPAIPRSLSVAEADAKSLRSAGGPAMRTSHGEVCTSFASGGSVFRHDPKLTTITCRSIDEIMEIHGSINAIQAGPFGRNPQVCRAYIFAVKRGRTTLLYLAWFLVEDREVLVCTPDRLPENAAGYADMMRDAVFYFESTGFMMDMFDLSKRLQRQLKALEESGICRFEANQAPHASVG